MANKNKALGRGLDDLFGIEEQNKNVGENLNIVREINVNDIIRDENQPRKQFKEDKIDELAESIKEKGIIQPITVTPRGNKYEIVVGERRWRASKRAGLNKIPCIIKAIDKKDRLEIALIENIQRENLNPIEEAEAYKEIMKELNITQEQLANKIGKSRTSITNSLRLLKLPEKIKQDVINEVVTEGHAKVLVGIEKKDLDYILNKIKKDNLSVRDVEKIVAEIKRKNRPHPNKENQMSMADRYRAKNNHNNMILRGGNEGEENQKNEMRLRGGNEGEENQKNEMRLRGGNEGEEVQKNKMRLRGGELVEEALTEYNTIENKNKSLNSGDHEQNNNVKDEGIYIPGQDDYSMYEDKVYLDKDDLNQFLRLAKMDLRKIFKANISINHNPSNHSGNIVISYRNKEHLSNILAFLGYGG